MATILLKVILFATLASALVKSWVGVAAYYTLSLWYPQMIWFWAFAGTRASFIVSIATIMGCAKDVVLGKVDFSVLFQKQNVYVVILWFSLALSYVMSPTSRYESENIMLSGTFLISYFNRVFFFYFVSVLLIDTREKLHYLIICFVVIVLYYIYWANDKYLSGGMWYGPRLMGPGPEGVESTDVAVGPYTDENNFAMLFVMGIPFLYFMGRYYGNTLLKGLLWGAIPLGWHAIFLTGSLGGMIGLGVVTGFIAVRSRNRLFLAVIPMALLVAFLWQGGFIKERLSRTEIIDSEQETSAQQRTNAWKAGFKMLLDHPITGVGLGNFLRAYPRYSDTEPHVAHNTFFQFASESGVLAGLMYLLLFYHLFMAYLRQMRMPRGETDDFLAAANDCIAGGALGFFVCSSFLNLATFEVLYYVFLLNVAKNRLFQARVPASRAVASQMVVPA